MSAGLLSAASRPSRPTDLTYIRALLPISLSLLRFWVSTIVRLYYRASPASLSHPPWCYTCKAPLAELCILHRPICLFCVSRHKTRLTLLSEIAFEGAYHWSCMNTSLATIVIMWYPLAQKIRTCLRTPLRQVLRIKAYISQEIRISIRMLLLFKQVIMVRFWNPRRVLESSSELI